MIYAWYDPHTNIVSTNEFDAQFFDQTQVIPLVAQKEWKHIDDCDIEGAWRQAPYGAPTWRQYARAISEKLKVKNEV